MSFRSKLVATFDRDECVIERPLIYDDGQATYTVRNGFRTDLASFPGIARIWKSKLGPTAPPSVLHDALYEARITSRREADRLFYRALRSVGVKRLDAFVIHLGVRLGGGWYWRRVRPRQVAPVEIEMAATGKLDDLSEKRLKGVHPDMQKVVRAAIAKLKSDVLVVEGLRTVSRQKKLVAKGASKTMNSRHITGHAVDLCAMSDGALSWGSPNAPKIAKAMKDAATAAKVELDWGGDWKSFVDTPHFELDWGSYPKQDVSWQEARPAPIKDAVKKAATETTKAAKKAPFTMPAFVVTAIATMSGYADMALSFGMDMVKQFSQVAPLKKILVDAGGSTSTITFSLIALVGTIAISKVFKPDEVAK